MHTGTRAGRSICGRAALHGHPSAHGRRCGVSSRCLAKPATTARDAGSAPQLARTGRKQRNAAKRIGLLRCAAAAVAEEAEQGVASMDDYTLEQRDAIRNIAIIAHVDHGKTTLVDSMLAQSSIFRENEAHDERIMDSDPLEKARGITILAKNTAITYKDTKINIIDTPGHADFGGEVERVLNMCDGVLLLVDSVEGPMPQTRFVLGKALELNKRVLVVVNKIDRPAARPDWVMDTTFDLFCDLGATDEQCDFPIVFASGLAGKAGTTAELEDTLQPLFEAIVREIPPPSVYPDAPLQLLVTNIDYDEHKGRVCIARINAGTMRPAMSVTVCRSDTDECSTGKIAEVFEFKDFARAQVEQASAGDIVALTGVKASIGDTVCAAQTRLPLPTITVEEPTVSMSFLINTSPFAGREGKYVTTRNIRDRLDRELERNLALKVESGQTSEEFIVKGRGMLHLGILVENMRREGFEFQVGPPKVIVREEKGKKLEPFDEATVDVPEEYVGAAVDLLGSRKGSMLDMKTENGQSRVTYEIPTRGLLGLKNALLSSTKGTAVLNTQFLRYDTYQGDFSTRELGSLVAFETGQVTAYALASAQERGTLFCKPGDEVYEGQVCGIHQRAGDLRINVCKKKALTNMRASGKDNTVALDGAKDLSLDDCLEYIIDDELVEVTPVSVRIRKNPDVRSANKKQK